MINRIHTDDEILMHKRMMPEAEGAARRIQTGETKYSPFSKHEIKMSDMADTYSVEKALLNSLDAMVANYQKAIETPYEEQTLYATAVRNIDLRWLAIAKTDIEKGFMALRRAIKCS